MSLSIPFLKKKERENLLLCLYITDTLYQDLYWILLMVKKQFYSKKDLYLAGFDKLLEDTDGLISDLEVQTHVSLEKLFSFCILHLLIQLPMI